MLERETWNCDVEELKILRGETRKVHPTKIREGVYRKSWLEVSKREEESLESWQVKRIRIESGYVELPARLYRLAVEIEDSRYLYELSGEEEDTQSVSYATWSRAVKLVAWLANRLLSETALTMPSPRIEAYVGGTVALYWKQDSFSVLVFVPAETVEVPTYSILPSNPSSRNEFENLDTSDNLYSLFYAKFTSSGSS
jgi:hypothetical protein